MPDDTPRRSVRDKSDDLDVVAVVGTALRGWPTLAVCGLVALLLGGYYAYGVAVPTFRAQTSLALDLRNEQLVDIESILSGVSTDDAAMNTEVEVIRSGGVLTALVNELNLTADPEFNYRLMPQSKFSVSAIADLVLGRTQPTLDDDALAVIDLERTVDAVRRAVSATVQPDTYIFNIVATTQDPLKSQRIANTLAQIYIADQIDQKMSATENAVTWLSERVTSLESELRQRENDLKSVRNEIDVVSVEGVEALNRQLIDARDRARDTQAEIDMANASLQRIAELRSNDDYEALAQDLDDPTLVRLIENDAASSVIAERIDQLARDRQSAIDRQGVRLEALQASVRRFEEQVSAQSDDLNRLLQIERQVQSTQILYETFLTRLKEASVQSGLSQADSRILTRANPGTYVAPRKGQLLILSLILGLAVGMALVLMRQFLHRGYRTAEDLEADTGYGIIGQIPLMPIKRRNQLISYLQNKPASAPAEAIRNLRTSLLLSSGGTPPQIIMSTSSLPGEGKTTQAISLAQNLAGLKKRVLLLEGDVRRRTLDEYFAGAETTAGGILSAMRSASFEEMSRFIVQDPRFDAHIMLGETARSNAGDIFSSAEFAAFLDVLREQYDHIVIDTPPVLVVPDARVIGQHVDAILFNVAWNRTSRAQVQESLRQLSFVNLDVTGLVLSQIDPSGMKRYGYGGKYGAYGAYGSSYYDT